jgi:hypothetical protein
MAATQAAESRNHAGSTEEVRQQLEAERRRLAEAVDELRYSTDLSAQLRAKLPLVLAAAFGVGFVLSGGIGATMRLLFRRSREGRVLAHIGRFTISQR